MQMPFLLYVRQQENFANKQTPGIHDARLVHKQVSKQEGNKLAHSVWVNIA